MSSPHAIPEGARLRILTASAKVLVTAEDRSTLDIDPPDRRVSLSDDESVIEIRSRSTHLHVRCPVGMNVSVGTISGRVTMDGEFGNVKASTVSGHINLDTARGEVDLRSVSGHVSVQSCAGRCHLNSKSGHVRADNAGGPLKASTISGDVELRTSGEGDVSARTISGGVNVQVIGNRRPKPRLKSFTGKITCDCPEGSDFELQAKTVSGRIEVVEG